VDLEPHGFDPGGRAHDELGTRTGKTIRSTEKHMHRISKLGLGLALVVGAASAAAAQSTQPDTRPNATHPGRGGRDGKGGERGMRGRGGPERALLKGITLTDAQKTRLQALRKEQEPQMKQTREQFGAVMKEAREARQRGDTVTARAKMEEVRKQMDVQREHQIASLRTILNADQQKQLDANIAAWKERAKERSAQGRRDHNGPRKGSAGR
jgi:Spy/CpxP family protein refolding chaperone